jgi:NADH:ubiquinone oxidoreductase subunit 3 (subunit A)
MLNAFYIEYFSVFVFLIISLILAFIIFFLSYFVATQVGGTEKLSAYECGFEPFEDARNTFDVRFYVVALLFIIFDLEVTFLFPWAVVLGSVGSFGFWIMIDFLVELLLGYIYVWKKGALD